MVMLESIRYLQYWNVEAIESASNTVLEQDRGDYGIGTGLKISGCVLVSYVRVRTRV